MIRTSQTRLDERSEQKDVEFDRYGTDSLDVDVEGDMILGDLEPDAGEADASGPSVSTNFHSKAKHNTGSIRHDVDDIVTGK